MIKMNTYPMDGIRPGKGFRDTLLSPLPMKDYISNESRLEHGIRVYSPIARYAQRSITLEFQIVGENTNDFISKRDAFYNQLSMGKVDLEWSEMPDKVFHLIYTGKSPSYSSGTSQTACKIKIGFDEPNPYNRA